MRRLLGLISLSCILIGCADEDADFEKARYLLGRGGIANAASALAIVTPYVEGGSSGPRRLEAVQLYVGAQMAVAGFDSIKIISALLYNDSNELISAISAACENVTSDAKTKLDDAGSKLEALFATTDFTNADTRLQAGLYFQDAIVDFLDSLRVLVTLTGLSEGTLDIPTCEAALADTEEDSNENNTEKVLDEYARDKLENASATLADATKGRLSASNDVVTSLDEIRTNIPNITAACQYLAGQD